MPKSYQENNKTDFTITVGASSENINKTVTYIYLFGSFGFALICLILTIRFLLKKCKKIKYYKIALLVCSILELLLFCLDLEVTQCCGYVLLLLPIINVVGAIITMTGKE